MKKIDAHAHVFDHIGSMGKAGELRPPRQRQLSLGHRRRVPYHPRGQGRQGVPR